eukprot:NODE_365_length_10088_cov_0.583041.p4 type:complete len:105 gc:universal NODE_365_length_10088_cov_0.583041:1561-1247(-)
MNIVFGKDQSSMCCLLNRPEELRDLLKMNDVHLNVSDDVLFASREDVGDSKWIALVSHGMTAQEIVDFKLLIGWIGENFEYIRKPRSFFGYSELKKGNKSKSVI